MLKSIVLANSGAYDATGTSMTELRQLNFAFGPNGSGKTTISRVIDAPETYPACSLTWTSASPLEVRVYNRDFVERHFDAASTIKGVYTFGENVEVAARIKSLKSEIDGFNGDLLKLKNTLDGGDGYGGKQAQRAALESKIVEELWREKQKLADLDQAFAGVNASKSKFFRRYTEESEKNTAALRDAADLREAAKAVFSRDLSEAPLLSHPKFESLVELESSAILQKRIIRKDDVDIAGLIKQLGNSDWVKQGREYYEKLHDQCPFCQQPTAPALRKSLEDYFDESYVADIESVNVLLENYDSGCKSLLQQYKAGIITGSPFLDREAYDKDLQSLQLRLEGNLDSLRQKKKEPSIPLALTDSQALFAAVDAHITSANAKATENNETFLHQSARKQELAGQIWRRLLEDSGAVYREFKADSQALDKAIRSLSGQIELRSKERAAKVAELEEDERKITSIKPTIDAINKLLKSFGFTNFSLAEGAEGGFYEVKRANGADAKRTISEGEKSFITFLYFYYLIGGSFSASGGTTDRIVVFDDPVSSLDADILFIVCNLIKGIVTDMRAGVGPIKQVFVLTHNIYFHKEVTFHKKRSGSDAMQDETFWIVRKFTEKSELVRSEDNPIKSSYELLWREVRQKPPSDTTIQNVMRRILEHYFKFFGGVTPEDVIEKFDGQDKIIGGSLMSWVNDGSHFSNDDLFMSCDPGQIERYAKVFQRIFEESDHGAHYRMMMGDAYVPLSSDTTEAEAQLIDLGQNVENTSIFPPGTGPVTSAPWIDAQED